MSYPQDNVSHKTFKSHQCALNVFFCSDHFMIHMAATLEITLYSNGCSGKPTTPTRTQVISMQKLHQLKID